MNDEMLRFGIYEKLINQALQKKLDDIPEQCKYVSKIDGAEASRILADYLADIIKAGLDDVAEKNDESKKISSQIELVNQIIDTISKNTKEDIYSSEVVGKEAEQLLALLDQKDPSLVVSKGGKGKTAKDMIRPETSIAQSSLFTGDEKEPQIQSEFKKEIASADRIDFLVSFIKWSGLIPLLKDLQEFTNNGGTLRVITTSYMGATDVKAIEELRKLPNTTVKISYNTKNTRLHAKTYVFHRDNGFSTAYIGSSNLSSAATTSGMEWNIKITEVDQPDVMKKIAVAYETYWHSSEFEEYTEEQKQKLATALSNEKYHESNDKFKYIVDVNPYVFQQEILDKLEAERKVKGHYRNLIVAATGCGKTVIAAFDYKRFCKEHPDHPCRLLFVAHRKEILLQARETFRAVLKDANFGDLFIGNITPASMDYLFLSKDTFYSRKDDFMKMDNMYYDYIVVDESHHMPATTYKDFLEFFKPQILLGLTATPERMDGKSILSYFDNRIAAEIRLPEAVERGLLCPFQYYGVSDNVDLSSLKWSKGGYDKNELTNVYAIKTEIARKRADLIVNSIFKYLSDINEVKGLGFCVSKEHAKFMSDYFNEREIPSAFLTSESPDEIRNSIKEQLSSGKIRFVFVVDLYNEGVDIPAVNTVLFLRPTESVTIFLQQLGRGLRLSEGKDCLMVLDFIGQANKRYNFEDKFKALLGKTKHSVAKEVQNGFSHAPKGCYIQLEKQATEYILKNIKETCGNTAGLISRISSFEEDTGLELSLKNFLEYYHLDPRQIYKYSSFSRLSVSAGKRADFNEDLEDILRKAMARFAIADSRRWVRFIVDQILSGSKREYEEMNALEKRMFQMFYVTIWQKAYSSEDDECKKNHDELIHSIVMKNELRELLEYQFDKIDFVDDEVDLGYESPLDVYCTYTRDQLLIAMDVLKPGDVREGTKYLKEKNTDVFLVTLNKSDKDYSPSTLYNDYSISDSLFHWQSQSTTSVNSPTGQRYIHHRQTGTRILLFVRENKKDSITGGAEGYTFLGLADYRSHEGSRPINFIWKLRKKIPAKFIKKTNTLMAN